MSRKTKFLKYYSTLTASQKRELASRAKTSVVYLSQIANGHRKAGAALISRLTKADRNLTPAMLRPDLF
jgi:transcriptional regulator with XRE-family HTH domain